MLAADALPRCLVCDLIERAGEQQRYVLHGAAMKDSTQSEDKPVVAIVWYRPEQWQRVRDIAADSDEFENTYVEWLVS